MEYKKEIQDELSELSPLLAKMRQEPAGFIVPENYFDYLSESIMEQVKLEPKSDFVEPSNLSVSQPWYAFLFSRSLFAGLASFAVLLVAMFFLLNQPSNGNELAEISSEEAEYYIANHLDEFELTLFLDSDLLGEINEIEFDENEINQFLEDNIDELDAATLEQLL